MWSIENFTGDWNLTIQLNVTSTNQNPFLRRIKFSEIQTNRVIPARRPDLELSNQKKKKKDNLSFSGFCHSGGPRSENKRKQDRQILDLARKLKKLRDMRMRVIPIVTGMLETVLKALERGLVQLKIRVKIEIIQTTYFRSHRILRDMKM